MTVSVSDGEVESACFFPVGSHVILSIRPENVTLSVQEGTIREDGGSVTSARNVFPGTVTRVTPMGFYQKVDLDCGFPLVSYVTMQSRESLKLAEGGASRSPSRLPPFT